jgi:hypothetical protein
MKELLRLLMTSSLHIVLFSGASASDNLKKAKENG